MPTKDNYIPALLFYEFKAGENNAAESSRRICKALGPGTISERTAQTWFVRFRSGGFSLGDHPRSGSPPKKNNLPLCLVDNGPLESYQHRSSTPTSSQTMMPKKKRARSTTPTRTSTEQPPTSSTLKRPTKKILSTKKNISRDLFYNIIWQKLLELDWKKDVGNRPSDNYFFPPGVSRDGKSTVRKDFFDSVKQVLEFLESDEKWSKIDAVKSSLELYNDCINLMNQMKGLNKLPNYCSAEWLVKEVENGKAYGMDTAEEKSMQKPEIDMESTEDIDITENGSEISEREINPLVDTSDKVTGPFKKKKSTKEAIAIGTSHKVTPIRRTESEEKRTNTTEAPVPQKTSNGSTCTPSENPTEKETSSDCCIPAKITPTNLFRSATATNVTEEKNPSKVATRIRSEGSHSQCNLFMEIVWTTLVQKGWKKEMGRNDHYYIPPGITRSERFTRRKDYFDSSQQVREFLDSDKKWSKDEAVKKSLSLYDDLV